MSLRVTIASLAALLWTMSAMLFPGGSYLTLIPATLVFLGIYFELRLIDFVQAGRLQF